MLKKIKAQFGGSVLYSIFRWYSFAFILILVMQIRPQYFLNANNMNTIHLFDISNDLSQMKTALLDEETGQRGYDLTDDPIFLQPFTSGEALFARYSHLAMQSSISNHSLYNDVKQMVNLEQIWIKYDGFPQISTVKNHHKVSTLSLLNGKSKVDRFRSVDHQANVLITAEVSADYHFIRMIYFLSIIINIFLLFLIFYLLMNSVSTLFKKWLYPIAYLIKIMEKYAAYDFSDPIDLNQSIPELNKLFIGIDNMQHSLSAHIQHITNDAYTDALTQIKNRRFLKERLLDTIQQNQIDSLFFMMLDIDHFKKINDEYGHSVGDDVLIAVASKILTTVPPQQIVVRYGGEEFAVVFTNQSKEETQKTANNILDSVRTVRQDISITISIGIAEFQNTTLSEWSVLKLINESDKALYRAKNNGRNRIEWYTNEQ